MIFAQQIPTKHPKTDPANKFYFQSFRTYSGVTNIPILENITITKFQGCTVNRFSGNYSLINPTGFDENVELLRLNGQRIINGQAFLNPNDVVLPAVVTTEDYLSVNNQNNDNLFIEVEYVIS